MQTDVLELECRCGALLPVPWDDLERSHPLPCAACGETRFWLVCEECEMGVYLDAEGDPCRECAPEPRRPGAPPYRPWAVFAVECPHCAGAFNHMRFTEGESKVMKCPHCGKRSRARYPSWLWAALLALFAAGCTVVVSVLGMLRATGRMGWFHPVGIAMALGLATLAAALMGRAMTLVPYRPGRR